MNFEIIKTGKHPRLGMLCLSLNTQEVKKFIIKNNLNFYTYPFRREIELIPRFDRGFWDKGFLNDPDLPYVYFSLPTKEILKGLIEND